MKTPPYNNLTDKLVYPRNVLVPIVGSPVFSIGQILCVRRFGGRLTVLETFLPKDGEATAHTHDICLRGAKDKTHYELVTLYRLVGRVFYQSFTEGRVGHFDVAGTVSTTPPEFDMIAEQFRRSIADWCGKEVFHTEAYRAQAEYNDVWTAYDLIRYTEEFDGNPLSLYNGQELARFVAFQQFSDVAIGTPVEEARKIMKGRFEASTPEGVKPIWVPTSAGSNRRDRRTPTITEKSLATSSTVRDAVKVHRELVTALDRAISRREQTRATWQTTDRNPKSTTKQLVDARWASVDAWIEWQRVNEDLPAAKFTPIDLDVTTAADDVAAAIPAAETEMLAARALWQKCELSGTKEVTRREELFTEFSDLRNRLIAFEAYAAGDKTAVNLVVSTPTMATIVPDVSIAQELAVAGVDDVSELPEAPITDLVTAPDSEL